METPSQSPVLATLNAKDPAFISAATFEEACSSLLERSQAVDLPGWRLKILNQQGSPYLSISRFLVIRSSLLPRFPSSSDDKAQGEGMSDDDDDNDNDDDDDDAAIHHQNGPTPYVEYNIILSPTYRVPVLYFFLHNLPNQTGSGLKTAHDLLVPKHLRATIKDMGVMGGISMSNHPITDFPTYFIHPCNTAEAMREIIGKRRVRPLEYLQIWIGLVGSCVGFYLPSQLAVDTKKDSE